MAARTPHVQATARHAVRAFALAALVASLATIATSFGSDSPTAVSRVAVSDEVVWPFYASTREELLQLADEPTVHADVARALGVEEGEVDLSAAATDGEIVVELSATTSDPALSVRAANVYAEELVAAGAARTDADRARVTAELRTQIENIDDRIVANDTRSAELGADLDALDGGPSAEVAVVQSQLQQIESIQREEARRRSILVQELDEAELSRGRGESDFSIIRTADDVDADVLQDPLLVALLVGIPMFLIGIGASVVWDQTFGRIRGPDDVRSASDVPVATARFSGDAESPEVTEINSLARRIARHQVPGSRWLLMPVGEIPQPLMSALAETLADSDHADDQESKQGSTSTRSGGAHTNVRSRISSENRVLVGELSSLGVHDAESVSGAVLVLVRDQVRIPALRNAIDELDVDGVSLEAIIVLAGHE